MVGSKWLSNNAWARVSRVGTLFGVTAMLCLTTGTMCIPGIGNPCRPDPCDEGQTCIEVNREAVCLVPCETNEDCNTADLCAPEACGTVTGADSNATFCVADTVECPEGEVCDPGTGECVEPCTDDAGCDDGAFCNGTETCDTDTGQCNVGEAPCVEPQVCDEEADACVDCLDDAGCDDGDNCTTDACTDGACTNDPVVCDAGVCNPDDGQCVECLGDGDCAENEVCINNNCVAQCLMDADCDDGDGCTTDRCLLETGLCESVAVVCEDDGDLCTTEACVDGACGSTPVECPEGQSCNSETGDCEEVAACVEDADCDDGLFCNGAETCVDGACVAGEDACANFDCGDNDPICSEGDTEAECTCPDPETQDFTLGQDNLSGTSGDDVFNAPLLVPQGSGTQFASLQTGDSANGLAGNDELYASFPDSAANVNIVATLAGIEAFFLTSFDADHTVTLTGTNITGVTSIWTVGSVGDVIVDNLKANCTAGLDGLADANDDLNLQFLTAANTSPFTGSADALSIVIQNTSAGSVRFTTANNGFESATIESTGNGTNTLSNLVATGGSTGLVSATFTGDMPLNLEVSVATILTYDASGMGADAGIHLGSGTDDTTYAEFANPATNMTQITGSPGADSVIFEDILTTTDFSSGTIDLGDGDDWVQSTFSAAFASASKLRNVEEVRFNASADGSSYNFSGATGLNMITIEEDGTSNTFTLTNVPATDSVFPTLNYRGDNNQAGQVYDTITYTPSGATGSSDSLAITIGNRGTALNATGTTNVHTIGGAATTLSGFETIGITVTDGPATFSGLTGAALTSLTATASSNLTLGTVTPNTTSFLETFNGSAVSGNVSATLDYVRNGATITTGGGNDAITIGANSQATHNISVNLGDGTNTYVGDTTTGGVDTVVCGSGNDTLTPGPGADTLTVGAGADTVIMDNGDTDEAVIDTITDFTAGTGGDILKFDFSSLEAMDSAATGNIGDVTDANNASIAGGEAFTITKVTADGGACTADLCLIDDDLATRANMAAVIAGLAATTIDCADDYDQDDGFLIGYSDGSGNVRIGVLISGANDSVNTDAADDGFDILILSGVDIDDLVDANFGIWQ